MIRRLAYAGSVGALALTAHAAGNLRLLRRAPRPAVTPAERVFVVLPVRDEEERILPCLQALSAALGSYGDARAVVVDDRSRDATAAVARAHADPRIEVRPAPDLPPSWLGKPHACAVGASARPDGTDVLVFLDADVVLAPDALVRAVTLLRDAGLDLLSPYPRQRAETGAERLVQPLLQWSWATFLPLRLAERSARPALGAANGQFLVVDASAYDAAGGHGAVRAAVLEDLELLKAFKRNGFRGTVADGTDLASCRMYDGWAALRDGYAKSLWTAFGSPAGAVGAAALLGLLYLLPVLCWLRRPRDPLLAAGALAGPVGRALVARRVRGHVPDAAGHPASIALLIGLIADSLRRKRSGTLTWKGRVVG